MLRQLCTTATLAAALASMSSFAVARTPEQEVCRALRALAASIGRGETLVADYTNSGLDDPLALSQCGSAGQGRIGDFCERVVDMSGTHGFYRFSAWIAECAKAQGARPRTHALPAEDWAPAFDHVEADLPHGRRLDLIYTPDIERHSAMYGSYRMTIQRR